MKARGFTVIELVIIIVMLGILAATTLPRYMDSSNDARRAINNATVAALNTSLTAVLARARVPGALEVASTPDVTSYYYYYVVNVDNNPNSKNNYIGFYYNNANVYPRTNIEPVVLKPVGSGIKTGTTGSGLPLFSGEAFSDFYNTGVITACNYFFNILLGDSSVRSSNNSTTTYNAIPINMNTSISLSIVNGLTTGNSGTFKSSSPTPLTSSFPSPYTSVTATIIPGNAPPGTSGSCVYKMNNTSNVNFYIIYDPVQAMFYSGES